MTSFGFGGPALSKDLVPISEALTCTIGGKDFTHDDVYILLGLKRCQDLNNKCVRICRPPCGADEAKHAGRVLVQFLLGEEKTFAKPSNLYPVTPERLEDLSADEVQSLELYNFASQGLLGIDRQTGAKVYDTRACMDMPPLRTRLPSRSHVTELLRQPMGSVFQKDDPERKPSPAIPWPEENEAGAEAEAEAEPKLKPPSRPITKLDKAMDEVRQHLHDAFNDKTVEGQELKLGRAYRTITQFEMDNAGKLTQAQAASIATTRDQVARYQIDLHESKPEPLSEPVDILLLEMGL